MKKFLSFLLALMMLAALFVSPVAAGSAISFVPTIDPGETRRETEYNYAWLDTLIVRDDPTAVVATALVPRPDDYPYSHTYGEFIAEVNDYAALQQLNEETISSSYEAIMELVYYSVVAMGMTDDELTMENHLRSNGIAIPDAPTAEDKVNIAVTYAALKYDAIYVLYGKEVTFPKGISAEGAGVIILSALTATMLPSGVNTYPGFAVLFMEDYIEQYGDEYPISKNPDTDEVFYWAKVITATENDYEVSGTAYNMVDGEEKEYVDYAYYATILEGAYDVHVDPELLAEADKSEDDLAVATLVLRTMLEEKNVRYSSKSGTEELFEQACANGCFNLDEEFYSDVLFYDVTVKKSCEKIWFTPFAVADQLEDGTLEAITMDINGAPAGHNNTVGVALDPKKANETITLTIRYNDGIRSESAAYTFNIIKDASLDGATVETGNNLVDSVQQFVNSVAPEGNEKVDEILEGVMQQVSDAVPDITGSQTGDILTTYNQNEAATQSGNNTQENKKTTSGFDYLDELLEDVYVTDENGNIITTKAVSFAAIDDEGGSVIERATAAVKENPEIVAAPTSIIALGALAGYLFTKKHRDTESAFVTEETEQEKEEE